jgi:8-oxo-dGTP pyrophosphatase MutT (NUDIX family)
MAEPEAAVAIVRTRDANPSVLLMRRAERDSDPWSGHWSFPGGRREPEDADILQTALRELEEECAVQLGRADLEIALPYKTARRRTGRFLIVAPFVFRVDSRPAVALDLQEAVEALWIPVNTLLDPACHILCPVPGWPKETLFPGIALNGAPLWGFTYRLITDWLHLAPEPEAAEQAGFQAATLILEFLLAHGLKLQRPWEERNIGQGAGARTAKVAEVKGLIPAPWVLAEFTPSWRGIPPLNRLEIGPDYIRIVGLAYEEYLIQAIP